MLIDDSERDRLIISRYLEMIKEWDVKVFTATNVDTGEKMIAAQKFDLILLDQLLKTNPGFGVIRKLRQAGIDLPIIMVSNLKDESLSSEFLQARVNDFLPKPELSAAKLQKSIEGVLNKDKLN